MDSLMSEIQKIREEVEALYTIQEKLAWFSRTTGEESILSKTYIGHEKLFSLETIMKVKRAEQLGGISDDERKALRYLRLFLSMEYVNLKTSIYDDRINNLEAETTVELPFYSSPIAYRDLPVLMAKEKDREKRNKIQEAMAHIWRERLNPILMEKLIESHRLIKELGYSSYVEFSQEYRNADFKALIRATKEFMEETDSLYESLLKEEVEEHLGIPLERMTRADMGALQMASLFKPYFPPELMVSILEKFLKGIGFDLKTISGTDIVIDDSMNPKKEPRAACFPIDVPRDVRISIKPMGGLSDITTLFHEAGHAIHFANIETRYMEFKYLGNYTSTEAFAEFFAYIFEEPRFIEQHNHTLKDYNRLLLRKTRTYPLITPEIKKKLIRNRLFWHLYFIRRYGYAKLIYETILHDGDPSIYSDVYDRGNKELIEIYQELFGHAYRYPLSRLDAEVYLKDVDDYFYCSDYLRAFLIAEQMHVGISNLFGDDWWKRKEVGTFLKENLFREGTKIEGEDISKILNFESVNYDGMRERIKKLLKEIR